MDWLDAQIQQFLLAENQLLHALILFVVLDYITGVCVAIQKKKLSSQIGAKGITRKVAIFVVIALCHIYVDQIPCCVSTYDDLIPGIWRKRGRGSPQQVVCRDLKEVGHINQAFRPGKIYIVFII